MALEPIYKNSEFDTVPLDLLEALGELQNVEADAIEEESPIPSKRAKVNAERLLKEMYQYFPRRYTVHSGPKGEVAVGAQRKPGRGILLLCDSQGGAMFFVSMNGKNSHKSYEDSNALPDSFILDALDKLGK